MPSYCRLIATVLLTSACAPRELVPGDQPPASVFLVLHVDPLSRAGDLDCADETLGSCGELAADGWIARTENLDWLAERWVTTGRTMDLQLGPEAALGWAEDATVTTALVEDLGTEDATVAVSEAALRGRLAIEALVAAGVASLGVHVHDVLPDTTAGRWGAVRYERGVVHPCDAWEEEPVQEADAAAVEQVVSYGVQSVARIADPLGEPLVSFTGHLPRSMTGKIAVVEDPDGLDPAEDRVFAASFLPAGLGSAYAECLHPVADHPPFELYPADADRALGAGSGPLITPGARVVGSMADHLDLPSDGSLDATARRFLELAYNWRYDALTGAPPRPWAFTFHEHLFDLYAGTPDARIADARDLQPREGSSYREDLEGLAALIDRFSGLSGWQGVAGPMARWALPEQLDATGSRFDYAVPDAPPEDVLEPSIYPYLPLVAELLADTHLTCMGERDGVEIHGFLRCAGGWRWGADDGASTARGFTCQEDPTWIYALIPDAAACLDLPGAARAAAIDDDALGPPPTCGAQLAVPMQGLLIEPAQGPWWSDDCEPWR